MRENDKSLVKLSDGSSIEVSEFAPFDPYNGYTGVVQSATLIMYDSNRDVMVASEHYFKSSGRGFAQLSEDKMSGLSEFLTGHPGTLFKTNPLCVAASRGYCQHLASQKLLSEWIRTFYSGFAVILSVIQFKNGAPVSESQCSSSDECPEYVPSKLALLTPQDGVISYPPEWGMGPGRVLWTA